MPKIEMIKCVRDNVIDIIISKEKLEQLNMVCKEYNNYDLAHKIYENIQEEVLDLCQYLRHKKLNSLCNFSS